MVKKRNSGSEDIETVYQSHGRPKQPDLALAGRPQPEKLADADEQLRTEVEELRRQVLELHENKDQDERSIQGWEWLARLAEENPDPVLQVSLDGAVQYRNPASFPLCRRWNPSDELIVPPAIHKVIKAACGRRQILRREMTFEEHTYLITVAPAPPPARYVNIYASDITARKQDEEALRELNATLESKVMQRTAELQRRAQQLQKLTLEMSEAEDRERKRLAEILHDDLQQIMAAAKFQLSLLRDQVKHDTSLHATALEIDYMLKEAIEKSRGLSHELSPAVSYHGDFAEALDWLAGQMQAKHGLVVHVHGTGELHLRSDTIKAFVYRTAQELLFNAAKHAQVKEAAVRVRRRGPYLCLSVSDRGRGFDPQGLREAGGFGLLSIRERIELLGGRMKIRSAPGRGSAFFVLVPDGETTAPLNDRTGSRARWATEHERRLRVLLADDHQVVRQGLISLFNEEDTAEIVGEASDGREAVQLVHRLHPDVVVMDVSMPVMSGEEAARQIKQDLPQTRIVALSMREDPNVRRRMYQAGAESYVLKTAPFKELLAAIHGKEPDS